MSRMRRGRGGRVVVSLLCALLLLLLVAPPHCDACDGATLPAAQRQGSVDRHAPAPQDLCAGVCPCCGLQAVPTEAVSLEAELRGEPVARPAPDLAAPGLSPVCFRPPRALYFA